MPLRFRWLVLLFPSACCFQLISQKLEDAAVRNYEGSLLNHQCNSRLTLVSHKPLLFVTKTPILTPAECDELSSLFESRSHEQRASSLHNNPILRKLQATLDDLIARPERDPIIHPRFLSYEPSSKSASLLPNGLHVETKQRQIVPLYFTVLVYLTSSCSSATTFPLAQPIFLLVEEQQQQQSRQC